VTYEEQASKDLLALARDEDWNVKMRAFFDLGSTFSDADQKWKEAHELAEVWSYHVRENTAQALGLVFRHLTDKEQAWKDLFALAKDEDGLLQRIAAFALGSSFPYLTDKEQATKDLLTLAKTKISMF